MKRFGPLIGIVLMICIGAGYYVYLMNKDLPTPSESTTVQSLDRLTTLDLDKNYPNTPIKVVEFYSDIMMEYYKVDTTDEIVEKLATQSRQLFDEELLLLNPEETFLGATGTAVDEFNENKVRITLYTIDDDDDVIYSVVNDRECAALSVKFYMRINNASSADTILDFILRKDDEGRWKILGWQVNASANQEGETETETMSQE